MIRREVRNCRIFSAADKKELMKISLLMVATETFVSTGIWPAQFKLKK